MENKLIFNLLPPEDLEDKLLRLRALMSANNLDSILICDNGNKYYLTGRVFSGYILIDRHAVFVRFIYCDLMDAPNPNLFKIKTGRLYTGLR